MATLINNQSICLNDLVWFAGSHVNSIEMVLQNRADVAAIDSIALQGFMQQRPEVQNDIFVLQSLGPLPIQPIMINSRLPGNSTN